MLLTVIIAHTMLPFQGMSYIHSSVLKHHGRLKSSNVLIDSRWTCKITDMGLRKFREGEKLPNFGDHAYYYRELKIN